MPTTSKQRKVIDSAYNSIPDNLEISAFKTARQALFDVTLTSERQHRKWAPAGVSHGLPVADAVRYFVVKWLLDAARSTVNLTPKASLHMRPECFMAYAIADEFRPQVDAWALRNDFTEFEALDYAKLME